MTGHVWGSAQDGDTGLKIRQWSSIIGIVTAIVGNILISFALNLQRYAHIRLEREHGRERDEWKDSRERGYAREVSEIADRRAELNLHAPFHEELRSEPESHRDKAEAPNGHDDPLGTSQISTLSRKSSDSTLQPREDRENGANTKSYLRSPYWWAGMLLMLIGESGNFLAYGFAPASIVSPLGVVALISNCIIAPCLLKERFRQRDFWGVVVAVGGACTVVLSAKTSTADLGPKELWSAITRWEFELYLGITTALIIALIWMSSKYGERSIGIDLGLVGLFGNDASIDCCETNLMKFIGGYTVLATKGVASLLSGTLWHTLTFPVTYLLIFILVLTAVLQIRYLNRALQRFDSTQVIPTQFVLFTLSAIIGSAVLYRDFEKAGVEQFAKFIGGCFLTFLGVYLITSGRTKGGDSLNDLDVDGEAEAISLVDEERVEHLNEGSAGEGDGPKRKSRPSFTLNKSLVAEDSRRQSKGQHSPPRTPHRFDSVSSSTMSRAIADASEGEQSPLDINPWRSSSEDVFSASLRPRPLETSESTPLLPSEAQHLDPRNLNQQPHDASSTSKRRSMSRMMPGPLISPLSSPLSAIVADSLRRHGDPAGGRRRLRTSGLRPTQSYQLPPEPRSRERSRGSSPLKSTRDPSDEEAGGRDRRRQSIAATFRDLFQPKPGRGQKGTRSDDGGLDDGERGRHNSVI